MHNKATKIIVVEPYARAKKKSTHFSQMDRNSDSYYVDSWGALLANRLKDRYPNLDIEVWRSEENFTETIKKSINGLEYIRFAFGWHLFSRVMTWEMLKLLYIYQKKYKLVIHLNSIFNYKFNFLMPFLFPTAKFIISHHGGVIPSKMNCRNKIKRKLILNSYRNVDAVTYLRKSIRDEIRSKNKKVNLIFLPVGADFNFFVPLDKTECRRKLNLPIDKVIAIYVGAFYKLKGVDNILTIHQQCANNNFEVILAGGNENDELYEKVRASGVKYWGRVNHDLLREIYSAADFYLHPAFHKNFGGIDVSWMEALACNRPVLTPQFLELDFKYSELGIAFYNQMEMVEKTQIMINSFQCFNKCRETAMKYLDANTVIIDKLYKIISNNQ